MKRLLGVLILLILLAFVATPAFAQGTRRGDHVCFGGNTVVEGSETPNSVVLFGCGGRIASGAQVSRDVVSFGGNLAIEEGVNVSGDVVVFGGNVDIAGRIGHRVTVFGGNVTLEPGAVVENDLQVFGNLNQRPGAVVRGRNLSGGRFNFGGFTVSPFAPFASADGFLGLMTATAVGLMRGILYAIAFAALGALTVLFLPTQTAQVGEVAEHAALPSLGVGCLTSIVAFFLYLLLIFVSILLAVTIIGIPLAVLLLVLPPIALAVAWLFGWIAIGRLVGARILVGANARETWRVPVIAVIVGIVLLSILGAVPFFGWLVSALVGLLGIGAVILSWFGTRPYPPAAPAPYALVPTVPQPPAPPAPPVPPAPPAAPSVPPAPQIGEDPSI